MELPCVVIILTHDNKSTDPERRWMKPYSTNELLHALSTIDYYFRRFWGKRFSKCNKTINKLKNLSDEDLSKKILNRFLKTDNFFDNPYKFFNITGGERIECIKKLLRLDHLNQDEYEHVERLIINSANRFQIPGEPLEAINVLQHSIPNIDVSPIFSRQYRFPPVHKEEITKQADELLKNKIIKPSQSLQFLLFLKNPIIKVT